MGPGSDFDDFSKFQQISAKANAKQFEEAAVYPDHRKGVLQAYTRTI